ncbi:MAG: dTDP-4-dehydrorhamnose 3,5-epimerase family protein [Saprospirales bacterium]|nr:dTDP-4-dehydrorhamnose 3,5-epimerase family protein [Saprospirales bacterium]
MICNSTRGLHFQYPPHTETKIVTCLKGEVFDVAVDLRNDSPTFLNWFGINLSPENNRSFFIPDGVLP